MCLKGINIVVSQPFQNRTIYFLYIFLYIKYEMNISNDRNASESNVG